MEPRIIIVEGYLAAGKSTFARQLSGALGVPCFIKDEFKIALYKHAVDINSREERSRFSAITFDAIMYTAERFIKTGNPLIIEGNFVPHGVKKVDEAGVIRTLLDKYECRSLTYKFNADTRILYDRFIRREDTPERGLANMMMTKPSYDEFVMWCRNLDDFDVGGGIVEVNTTDFNTADFRRHIGTAREFLHTLTCSASKKK